METYEDDQFSVQKANLTELAKNNDFQKIASILEINGRGSVLGDLSENLLKVHNIEYKYQEEIGHLQCESVCVARGTGGCSSQGSNGTCYAPCKDYDHCLGAIWEENESWIIDFPRRVIINS